MKKVGILSVVLTLILSIFFTSGIDAQASGNKPFDLSNKSILNGSDLLNEAGIATDTTEDINLIELKEEYGLEELDLSKIPDNIPVITFDNEEDLKRFLEETVKLPNEVDMGTQFAEIKTGQISEIPKNSSITTFSNYTERSVSKTVSNVFGLGAKVTLKAKVKIYSSSSFRSIVSVSKIRSEMTGFTLGYSYSHKYGDSKIAKDGQSVKISSEGILNYVIFFEGVGTIYSRPFKMSMTYKL